MVFAAREELAVSLHDVLVRRTQLAYRDLERGRGVAAEVAGLMGPELGWDDAGRAAQVEAYLRATE